MLPSAFEPAVHTPLHACMLGAGPSVTPANAMTCQPADGTVSAGGSTYATNAQGTVTWVCTTGTAAGDVEVSVQAPDGSSGNHNPLRGWWTHALGCSCTRQRLGACDGREAARTGLAQTSLQQCALYGPHWYPYHLCVLLWVAWCSADGLPEFHHWPGLCGGVCALWSLLKHLWSRDTNTDLPNCRSLNHFVLKLSGEG